MTWRALAVGLLVAALALGQALLGSRPTWATSVLFLALVPAAVVTVAAHPPELVVAWRGRLVLALTAIALLQVWRLPTLEARGWTVVTVGLVAFAATLAIAADPRFARRLALALVVLGALQALYGLVQSAGGFDVLGAEFREPGRIATGSFTNRNHLAGFLNIAQAMTLGLLSAGFARRHRHRRSERWAWTWMLILVGGLMGLAVLLSQSRAGTLSLVATVVFVSLLLFLERRFERKGLPAAAAWILLAVVSVLGLAVGVESLFGRFEDLSGARPEIFRDSLELVGDHWLLGVGPGIYRWAFRPYQTVDLAYWYTHAHNDYLEIAADFGLPLALLFWAFVFRRLYRAARLALEAERSLTRGLALGAAGAIFSIALHSFVDFNLQIPANLVAFVVVLGIGWSLERQAYDAEERGAPGPAHGRIATAATVALLALSVAAGWTTSRRLQSELLVRFPESLADFERAAELVPDDPEIQLALGRRLRDEPDSADRERARVHLERAVALNPRGWQHRWELARLHELAGRPDDARTVFAAAFERNPRDGRYRWRYANFLLRQGEREAMLPELRAAIVASPALALPAWNLLSRLDVSSAELDRAWPEDPDARLQLLHFATRSPEPTHLPFLLGEWTKLLDAAPPLAIDEGAFFLSWLLRLGEADNARRQWLALAAANGLEDPDYFAGTRAVWNGGFEIPPTRSPFDWHFHQADGFELRLESGAGRDGSTALRIDFDGSENLHRVLASQLTSTEPGTTYRLSFSVRSRDITTDQGPALEIVARPGGSRIFAAEMILGETPWQNHTDLVTAPSATTHLELRLRRWKSLRIDSKIHGTLWLDDVRLEPIENLPTEARQ